MNAVWESMFLLGLGLLAINITVFVLAIARLPTALKVTDKEIKNAVDASKAVSAISRLNLLTSTSVVFLPGIAYLFAIGVSIWGRYTAEMNQKTNWVMLVLVSLALIFGIVYLYKAIRAIEDISINALKENNKRLS